MGSMTYTLIVRCLREGVSLHMSVHFSPPFLVQDMGSDFFIHEYSPCILDGNVRYTRINDF